MIDVSNIRVGDEVTVRGRIYHVCDQSRDGVGISFGDDLIGRRGVVLPIDLITTHTPAPRGFKPGDTVYAGSNIIWKIEHVNGPWAWIMDNRGCNRLEAIANLRHADESE